MVNVYNLSLLLMVPIMSQYVFVSQASPWYFSILLPLLAQFWVFIYHVRYKT